MNDWRWAFLGVLDGVEVLASLHTFLGTILRTVNERSYPPSQCLNVPSIHFFGEFEMLSLGLYNEL
jgi:hypothetical protein